MGDDFNIVVPELCQAGAVDTGGDRSSSGECLWLRIWWSPSTTTTPPVSPAAGPALSLSPADSGS